MSDGLISLFLGAGAAAWFYTQLARRSGNASPSNNMVAAGVGGLLIAIVAFTILKFILKV